MQIAELPKVDRVLVHSLSPNIYRTIPEAIQAFNNFSNMGKWDEHFSTFERLTAVYVGSAAMWLIGKRLKKRYALKDDVRETLYDNCRLWLKAIGKNRQFMGGDRPNLADPRQPRNNSWPVIRRTWA